MKKGDEVRVGLHDLIRVFDEHNVLYKGHTTPIIGFIGEDLNAAIFTHYLANREGSKNARVLPYPVNTGQKRVRGRELDRWIKSDKVLYQTEIKNWCSFMLPSYKLLVGATDQERGKLAKEKWEVELKKHYRGSEEFGMVSKVLLVMKIPKDLIKKYKVVKPLIIHWMPISNKKMRPFFSCSVEKLGMSTKLMRQVPKSFTKINYFSCSLYIRELIDEGKKNINLSLPNVGIRMEILKKLINLK